MLEVLLEDKTHTLRSGQRAVTPRNTLHRFRYPTAEPTTFMVELRPGSQLQPRLRRPYRPLAKRARRKGVDRELVAKYCR